MHGERTGKHTYYCFKSMSRQLQALVRRRRGMSAAAVFHCHSAPVVAFGNRWPVWRATMTI